MLDKFQKWNYNESTIKKKFRKRNLKKFYKQRGRYKNENVRGNKRGKSERQLLRSKQTREELRSGIHDGVRRGYVLLHTPRRRNNRLRRERGAKWKRLKTLGSSQKKRSQKSRTFWV